METTGPQRAAFAAMINKGGGVYVGDVPRTGLRALLNDADRLDAIERQVLWRTEDMPEGVAAWERDKEGTCIFWMRLECGVIPWATAPDYRPNEEGPLFLPILDPEQP